ncbi:hypothetical protein NDU88_007553 [Pleurodeles waltl]|uniref:Uncharacterized protein n=1 Tax=Pleurodeles waltl TaxID=8319 RepID=A0AAV7WHT0_PLEWA|nr:hypothetical protein NDU88_007553 [Pleurodeles waltl]
MRSNSSSCHEAPRGARETEARRTAFGEVWGEKRQRRTAAHGGEEKETGKTRDPKREKLTAPARTTRMPTGRKHETQREGPRSGGGSVGE